MTDEEPINKKCEFCNQIVDFKNAEQMLKSKGHGSMCLCKSPNGNVGLCMHIIDVTYVCSVNYCPVCGRKLTED